jgi:hypothetical protein
MKMVVTIDKKTNSRVVFTTPVLSLLLCQEQGIIPEFQSQSLPQSY